jgi:hypothetical protein
MKKYRPEMNVTKLTLEQLECKNPEIDVCTFHTYLRERALDDDQYWRISLPAGQISVYLKGNKYKAILELDIIMTLAGWPVYDSESLQEFDNNIEDYIDLLIDEGAGGLTPLSSGPGSEPWPAPGPGK